MKLFSTKHDKYEGRHCSRRCKSRRSFKAVLSLCLLLILGVCFTIGGTLAFMQEQTGAVTNTFKAGEISYALNLQPNADNVDMPKKPEEKQSTSLSVTFTPDKAPTKIGYTFGGWYYNAACTDTKQHTEAPGTSITVNYSDPNDSNTAPNKVEITLYAKWTANSYTIAYDNNGGSGSMENTPVTYDQDVELSKNTFTKTGYTFTGWNTNADGSGTSYTDEATVKNLATSGTVTLYAQWQPITYTVVYDKNGDDKAGITGSTASSTHTYDTAEKLTENGYIRTGYTFIGWNTTSDGTGTYYEDKESVTNLTAESNGTVTLYAQWGAKSYVIRYHANGGNGSMADQTIKYDVPTELRANAFAKADYTFGGWALSSDGEKKYINKQIVVNLLETGTLDLYAVWIQDSHTVTFDYNGGSGSPDSIQVQAGKVYGTLPEYPVHPTEVREGNEVMSYLFTGWYTEKEGGTRVYPSTMVNRTDDHTLYAHWKEAPTNNVIQNMTVKNNPDDNGDGVVDAFYVNLTCSSSFEKYNIPLENLVVGQKYKLSFTESNNATYGNNEKGYSGAIYGFIITPNKTLTGSGIKEESIADGGLIKQWSDRNDGALNGPRTWETTFTAEASTMYWTWDYGLILDGHARDYNYTNIRLVPVEPEIEFNNKKLVLYSTSKAQVLNDTSSAYATNFVFDGDSYAETMYYPITGLTVGTTYTVTFDHKFSGSLIHDGNNNPSYHYGCGIMNAAPTVYGSYMNSISTSWASDTFVMSSVTGNTESVTLTFTATGDTAYWVWNMANCSDSVNCTIDVKVTNFSAQHKNGGHITYYDAASQATTLGLTIDPTDVPEITLDWEGINDTYLNIWYPVDEQHPIAGESYELAFEPMEGYTMSEIIVVAINDVTYEVYTDGRATGEDGMPAYDAETNILTIPAELLTLNTTTVAVTASAVPVDISMTTEPEVVPEDTEADGDPETTPADEAEITVALNLTNMTAQGSTTLQAGEDYSIVLTPDDGFENNSEPATDNTVSTGDSAVLPPDNKGEDSGDETDGNDKSNDTHADEDGTGDEIADGTEETTNPSEEVAE